VSRGADALRRRMSSAAKGPSRGLLGSYQVFAEHGLNGPTAARFVTGTWSLTSSY
jgi:hypothetical protein